MEEQEQRVVPVGPARLLIGLVQGLMLYGIFEVFDGAKWSQDSWLIVGLLLVTALVPVTALAGLTGMRPLTLGAWVVVTITAIAGIVWHAVNRNSPPSGEAAGILFVWLPPLLFVAYHLVAGADDDRRLIARYQTYFDIGWKNGVQLALSVCFVGAFWLLLWLGAALFSLINIHQVRDLITERWFALPAVATAFAAAVHVSDARVGLITGARTLGLMVLSWLLPVMALFAIAFLATLAFVGLAPLWATGATTPLLLTAAIVLVILINAAYQDGEHEAHPVLRFGARIAALAIAPLVAIAAYSVWLRINQHGLTPDRIIGMACVAVAACYAVGYAAAAIAPGRWMKPIELTNILASFVALGLSLALLTPIADPARIAVNDQVRRLQAGLTPLEEFDFDFLRFQAARYGREALDRLAADKSSDRARAIASKAEETIKKQYAGPVVVPDKPDDLLAKINVNPRGAKLPDSFLKQDWSQDNWTLGCARDGCNAFFIDIDGDRQDEILLLGRFYGTFYKLTPDTGWIQSAYLDPARCAGIDMEALRTGRFNIVAPTTPEIEVLGKRVQITRKCPDIPVGPPPRTN